MAYPLRYATLHHLRKRGVSVATLDDDDARDLLNDISRWVDEYTYQVFYPLYSVEDLDGKHHRILTHPHLWPILSTLPTIVEVTERTRETAVSVTSSTTLLTVDSDVFSIRTTQPRRKIFKSHGVWNEGSHNYRVTGYWGWMDQVNEVDYTLSAGFDGTSDRLYLTDVTGLRPYDVGILGAVTADTALTIVEVDVANNYVTVDGVDLLAAAALSGATFTRWGQVPTGIRKFVLEAAYMSSGADDVTGDGGWLKSEKTDNYEYNRHSPKDMGMVGGEFFTGNIMIDSGLARYRKPGGIEII